MFQGPVMLTANGLDLSLNARRSIVAGLTMEYFPMGGLKPAEPT